MNSRTYIFPSAYGNFNIQSIVKYKIITKINKREKSFTTKFDSDIIWFTQFGLHPICLNYDESDYNIIILRPLISKWILTSNSTIISLVSQITLTLCFHEFYKYSIMLLLE